MTVTVRLCVLLVVATAIIGCCQKLSIAQTSPRAAHCTPADSLDLNVPLNAQETPVWCWNASGQMIMNFLGASPPISQCKSATLYIGGQPDCCSQPRPAKCITTGWPVFTSYGFSFRQTRDSALSFTDLTTQIACNKAPVAFTWHWIVNGRDSGGHIMVARGFLTEGGREFVNVNNPWPPPQYDPKNPNGGDQGFILYEDYVSGPDHRHWVDFYDISKTSSLGTSRTATTNRKVQ